MYMYTCTHVNRSASIIVCGILSCYMLWRLVQCLKDVYIHMCLTLYSVCCLSTCIVDMFGYLSQCLYICWLECYVYTSAHVHVYIYFYIFTSSVQCVYCACLSVFYGVWIPSSYVGPVCLCKHASVLYMYVRTVYVIGRDSMECIVGYTVYLYSLPAFIFSQQFIFHNIHSSSTSCHMCSFMYPQSWGGIHKGSLPLSIFSSIWWGTLSTGTIVAETKSLWRGRCSFWKGSQ